MHADATPSRTEESMSAAPESPKPSKPVTPAQLLTAAAQLNFRATARDRSGSTLGVLVDASGAHHHLAIAPGTDADDGTWTLLSELPRGRRNFLLYESAANVMRGGSWNADGSISYQGASYVIESSFDGNSWAARVRGSA
jgi:hypothetical protein